MRYSLLIRARFVVNTDSMMPPDFMAPASSRRQETGSVRHHSVSLTMTRSKVQEVFIKAFMIISI